LCTFHDHLLWLIIAPESDIPTSASFVTDFSVLSLQRLSGLQCCKLLSIFLASSKDELMTRTHYGELITVNLLLRTALPHIRVSVVNNLPK